MTAINDPKGEAGSKKAPMWLLPPVALEQTAWVAKLGAEKYGPYNWRKTGVCATTYVSAIMRHLNAWRDGEDLDPESGISHIAHIATSCNILMDAAACGTLQDDRNKKPPAEGDGRVTPDEVRAVYDSDSTAPRSGVTIDGAFVPFPPVPAGYDRWEYRGMGWNPGRRVRYEFLLKTGEWTDDPTICQPTGAPPLHYIEAVKDVKFATLQPNTWVDVTPMYGDDFRAFLTNILDVRGTKVYTFGSGETLTEDEIISITIQA